jgi:hypothetical protein
VSSAQPDVELVARPRFCTARRIERPTRGPLIAGVAKILGWTFFDWQSFAADVAMEYHALTKLPCYRTVGVDVARQNGKTTLVLARIASQLIMPKQTVAYTAQDRSLAVLKWSEHVGILRDTPFWDRVAFCQTGQHKEMLVMNNGSRYLPVTPSRKKAGRSLSLDLAVIDEAQAHESMAVVSALQPTMAAKLHAQLWILGCAGELTSELLNHYVKIGRLEVDNPASSLCWIEYSAEEDADVFDRKAWLDANPSLDLPNGVSSLYLSGTALTMDVDTFRREHLNIQPSATTQSGIDKVRWAACRNDKVVPGEHVAFSLDMTPEGDRGALVAASVVDALTPIEVLEAGSDIERLVARAIEVATNASAERRKKDRAVVVIDRANPAYSAVPALELAGVAVRLIPSTEFGAACVEFFNAAKAATLTHNGDYRLTDAVEQATKRTMGDKWAWARRGSNADITCLCAATMARWGVLTTPAPGRSAYEDDDELDEDDDELDETVDESPGVFIA